MKSFIKYLTESKKTYHFKVRIANCDMEKETQQAIEDTLKQFDLVKMSKPKNHPPEERSNEFPKLGPVEVKDFDIELDYPTVDMAVRQAISYAAGLDIGQITVYTKDSWEQRLREIDRVEKAKKGESLLDTEKLEAEEKPADSMSMLKDLETRKYEFAGDKTERAKTTNDIPQGNVSPVGSNKPKLPEIGKRK
jgi:hypothetical protein